MGRLKETVVYSFHDHASVAAVHGAEVAMTVDRRSCVASTSTELQPENGTTS